MKGQDYKGVADHGKETASLLVAASLILFELEASPAPLKKKKKKKKKKR
jgi:hypothetical protein